MRFAFVLISSLKGRRNYGILWRDSREKKSFNMQEKVRIAGEMPLDSEN